MGKQTANNQYDQTKQFRNHNQHNCSSKYPHRIFDKQRSTNDDNESRTFYTGFDINDPDK